MRRSNEPRILVDTTVENADAMKIVLERTCILFKRGWALPPIRYATLADHIPCRVLITKTNGKGQHVIGRIQFLAPSGDASYDETWTIKQGTKTTLGQVRGH
jgi:hypothetical protein